MIKFLLILSFIQFVPIQVSPQELSKDIEIESLFYRERRKETNRHLWRYRITIFHYNDVWNIVAEDGLTYSGVLDEHYIKKIYLYMKRYGNYGTPYHGHATLSQIRVIQNNKVRGSFSLLNNCGIWSLMTNECSLPPNTIKFQYGDAIIGHSIPYNPVDSLQTAILLLAKKFATTRNYQSDFITIKSNIDYFNFVGGTVVPIRIRQFREPYFDTLFFSNQNKEQYEYFDNFIIGKNHYPYRDSNDYQCNIGDNISILYKKDKFLYKRVFQKTEKISPHRVTLISYSKNKKYLLFEEYLNKKDGKDIYFYDSKVNLMILNLSDLSTTTVIENNSEYFRACISNDGSVYIYYEGEIYKWNKYKSQ